MNMLLAFLLVSLVLLVFVGSLGIITRHNKVLKIPMVTGKPMRTATSLLNDMGFETSIQDSVYIDTIPPLTVIRQFPEADAAVKINRTVYLTVNRAVPPLIAMPRLVGSFRSAVMILKQFGLKLGDTSYRPDFAKNSILSQQYNGQEIRPGTKIPMGSAISLVLGSGVSKTTMAVPDMFGMTYEEAKATLDSMGIGMVPVMDPGVTTSQTAYIYRQHPDRLTDERKINRIRPGQMIDLWLSAERKERIDTTTVNEPVPDQPETP